MKKIMYILFVLCLLCGCSGEKEPEKMVCTGITSGVIDVTNTFTYENDKVLTQTVRNEVSLEALNVAADEIEALTEQFEKAYAIDGVTYKWEVKDNVFAEEIVIDFDEADFEALKALQLISAEDENADITYVSFEQTKKALEDLGMTCK